MIHVQTYPICPTRPEHLEVGALYQVCGSSDNRGLENIDSITPIPPQVIRIEGKPVYEGFVGAGYVVVTHVIHLGAMGVYTYHNTVMALDRINIPPVDKNDFHLERIPDNIARMFEMLQGLNRKDDYKEIVTGKSP
jgi:hypothetical protein